jgi:DNA ligase-1
MDELRLYTKNMEATVKYPELYNPLIPKGTILDGELVVLDEQGKAGLQLEVRKGLLESAV